VIDEKTIEEAGRRIAAAAPGARVILFGSYARGDANRHSDLDFLVIKPEVTNRVAEAAQLLESVRTLQVPVDVLVIDEDKARRRSKVAGTTVERALREGRVLVP
jgi:predicted nucleotidyltransferase